MRKKERKEEMFENGVKIGGIEVKQALFNSIRGSKFAGRNITEDTAS